MIGASQRSTEPESCTAASSYRTSSFGVHCHRRCPHPFICLQHFERFSLLCMVLCNTYDNIEEPSHDPLAYTTSSYAWSNSQECARWGGRGSTFRPLRTRHMRTALNAPTWAFAIENPVCVNAGPALSAKHATDVRTCLTPPVRSNDFEYDRSLRRSNLVIAARLYPSVLCAGTVCHGDAETVIMCSAVRST